MKKITFYSDDQMFGKFIDYSITGQPLSALYNDPRCQPELKDRWITMEEQLGVTETEKLLNWNLKPAEPWL